MSKDSPLKKFVDLDWPSHPRMHAPPVAIGNTPWRELHVTMGGIQHEIWIKEEYSNAFGSIKDRVAWALLAEAIDTGAVERNGRVVDASSGNYAIALASLGRILDLRVEIAVSAGVSEATLALIEGAGATIHVARPEQGETLHAARIALAGKIARQLGASFLDQYNNKSNPAVHHAWTAPEIFASKLPDAMFVSASSGGTAAGLARYIREKNLPLPLIVVDSIASNILERAPAENALRIPGMGSKRRTSFIPEPGTYQVLRIREGNAFACFTMLAGGGGLSLGLSSCGVLAGVLGWLSRQTQSRKVAMLGVDGAEKYLPHVAACQTDPALAQEAREFLERYGSTLKRIAGLWS